MNTASLLHNLRRSPDSRSYRPVGYPSKAVDGAYPGARLLPGSEYVCSDGRVIFFFIHGRSLLCVDGSEVQVLDIGNLEPSSVFSIAGRLFVASGTGQPVCELICTAGRWQLQALPDEPEPIAIVRRDSGTLSANIDAMSLSGVYSSRITSLTADDERRIASAFSAAYCSIGDRAIAKRVWFQPLVACLRLRDKDGNVLHTSTPVLISPAAGLQLDKLTLTLSGSSFSQLDAATVSVDTFTLALVQTAPLSDEWQNLIATVEILVSPQLHPLDDSAAVDYRFGRFTTTTGSLTVNLPGLPETGTAVAAPGTLFRSRVALLVAGGAAVFRQVATARYDSATDSWIGADRPFYPDCTDTRADIKALRSALSQALAVYSSGRLAACHTLSPAVTASGGDLAVFAGLSLLRSAGALPSSLSVVESKSPLTGHIACACRITFADGSSCVRTGLSDLHHIESLSPLVVYPSPDAVGMELYVGASKYVFPLTPDPSGTVAYWLADDLLPIAVTDSSGACPVAEQTASPYPLPDIVAVSDASAPLSPVAWCGGAAGTVAIMPATVSGLDSGAATFYLFGNYGIKMLTVSSARNRATLRSIDSRPVASASAVCRGADCILAVAGGDLVAVSGRTTKTLHSGVGLASVAYNPRHGEIICFYLSASRCPVSFSMPDGDNVSSFLPDALVFDVHGRLLYSRSFPPLSSVLSASCGLRAVGAAGEIFDLLSETDDPVDVAASMRVTLHPARRRASHLSLRLPLVGRVDSGTAAVHADCGGGVGAALPVARFSLSASLPHLPPLRLLAPHAHALTLSLRLSARPSGLKILDV